MKKKIEIYHLFVQKHFLGGKPVSQNTLKEFRFFLQWKGFCTFQSFFLGLNILLWNDNNLLILGSNQVLCYGLFTFVIAKKIVEDFFLLL
jgi:hypothetical protein